MTIYSGVAASISMTLDAGDKYSATTSFIRVFSYDATGTADAFSASYKSGWELRLNRQMVNVTAKRRDGASYVPSTGTGVCLIRGWVDNSTNPGSFNNIPALVILHPRSADSNRQWRLRGWITSMTIRSFVDGPNSLDAVIVVNEDPDVLVDDGYMRKKWTA